ncbi:hypothetical protein C8R45DRAFT_1183826 [Mycena sanguinolenta]|nr:hypothetical protein C8R45DRAFT_1183826 [Mycena sanguinolenta]
MPRSGSGCTRRAHPLWWRARSRGRRRGGIFLLAPRALRRLPLAPSSSSHPAPVSLRRSLARTAPQNPTTPHPTAPRPPALPLTHPAAPPRTAVLLLRARSSSSRRKILNWMIFKLQTKKLIALLLMRSGWAVRTTRRTPDRERGHVGGEEQEDESDEVVDQKDQKRK